MPFNPLAKAGSPVEAMQHLDRWVAGQGNGRYLPSDITAQGPYEIFPNYGIQQVREEISAFVGSIAEMGLGGTILEVGLGYSGSTHFLWRQLFDTVVTIDMNPDRARAFVESYARFADGYWCGTDGRSQFVFGASQSPATVGKVFAATDGRVDALFIDGDHGYAGVLCDWLLYHNLVREGGIVAFHDIATPDPRVSEAPRLIAQLERGEIDGKQRRFHRIVASQHAGIAYYVV